MTTKVDTKEISQDELLINSLGCPGCSVVMAVRWALKVLGERTVAVIPACCLGSITLYLPQLPFKIPVVSVPFSTAAAVANGISAGLRQRGITDINVVGMAGDGGTADIGLAAFSQAIVGGRKFIYICLDNEAYMNTGVQWSSETPYGAITSTGPVPEVMQERDHNKKDLFGIVLAHNIPYAATACTSYPLDFMEKVKKAMETNGPAFIHVLSPCTTGWGYPDDKTIEIGRLAVESGMWYLCEYQKGKVSFTYKPEKKVPVSQYISLQSRFRQMKPEHIAQLQSMVDRRMVFMEALASIE